MNTRSQLGDFLRHKREQLSPAELQLPVGTRRRTPGLRRDEVAGLANISTVYYERLEQGRGPHPSVTVLASVSEALRLSHDERTHLYLLAGQAPPMATPASAEQQIDPGLEHVLRAVEQTTPAFMTDDLSNVVAQNRLNVALFGDFSALPGRERNLIWRWFTSARWRDTLEPAEQHEAASLAYVADLRAAVAQRGHDGVATSLVNELRSASDEFARMWDRHVVSTLHCAAKVIHDPRVGRLDFDCLVLTSALSRQRLLLMKPVPGTCSEGRLAVLARY